jgi:soluble lytic murein transglycosylase
LLFIFPMTALASRSFFRFLVLIPALALAGATGAHAASARAGRVPSADEQNAIRESHARELMGKHWKRSAVRRALSEVEISQIQDLLKDNLPKAWKKKAPALSRTLLQEAAVHRFDPFFLLAVIQTESSFRPDARGADGEIGLMQLMPKTAQWIAPRAGVKWKGEKTLLDPVKNVRIGAAYLSWLRERFDSHSRLYLAAYNMGATNVNRALDRKVWPKDYPSRVMQHYVRFYRELMEENARSASESRSPAAG